MRGVGIAWANTPKPLTVTKSTASVGGQEGNLPYPEQLEVLTAIFGIKMPTVVVRVGSL